jgi:ribosomal protein S3
VPEEPEDLIYVSELRTPNDQNYYTFTDAGQQQLLKADNMVYRTLKFKTSNDAHIGLFQTPRRTDSGIVDISSKFYEIVIGASGNTMSVIRDSSQRVNKVEVTGAPCQNDTWVWITVG